MSMISLDHHHHKNHDTISSPLSMGGMKALLGRVSYKPGWSFEILGPFYSVCSAYMLHATSEEPHSREPGVTYTVHRNYLLPLAVTPVTFLAHLRLAIRRWELHEACEFLRFDGEILHDPHACEMCMAGEHS